MYFPQRCLPNRRTVVRVFQRVLDTGSVFNNHGPQQISVNIEEQVLDVVENDPTPSASLDSAQNPTGVITVSVPLPDVLSIYPLRFSSEIEFL